MAHQQRENPPRGLAAGFGNLSCLENIDGPELSPTPSRAQEESAAATAPELLDFLYLNVELELRLGAVKAIQAATDFEIGDSDEVAERGMLVAANCLKGALANFDRIKEAKVAAGAAILADELFSAGAP